MHCLALVNSRPVTHDGDEAIAFAMAAVFMLARDGLLANLGWNLGCHLEEEPSKVAHFMVVG